MNLEIRRSNASELPISGILPSTAYPVGKPMMVSAYDADTGARTLALASGRCDGFLTRASRVPTDNDSPVENGNPRTAEEQLMGFGMESPFVAGREGSIERGDLVAAEGSDYIFKSGTGALTTGTALGTKCSFTAGKFYVAQSGDFAQFRVAAQLTPETSGDVRILFQRIEGYIV